MEYSEKGDSISIRMTSSDLISKIEQLIRLGDLHQAAQQLESVDPRQQERGTISRLSDLSWRAGIPIWGLKAMHPVVQSLKADVAGISDEERIIYALCLTKAGASSDAFLILDAVESQSARWHFAMAAAHVNRWAYCESLPHLQTYLESELDPYARRVGQANVLAAYVYERRFVEAETLYGQLLSELEKQSSFLRSKVRELFVQLLIWTDRLAEARGLIEVLGDDLSEAGELDKLYLRKWRALVELRASGGSRNAVNTLCRVQEQASQLGHWESIRQIDRWLGQQLEDDKLLDRVYFGTPFSSFRRWLCKDLQGRWRPSEKYVYGQGFGPPLPLHRPLPGLSVLPQRMLLGLCSDFYRPLWISSLHRILYRGERFNPYSSPNKIHQVKRQLRKWLESRYPETVIEESGGRYRLRLPAGLALELRQEVPKAVGESRLEKLHQAVGEREFSVNEASEMLGLSRATVLRLLRKAGKSEIRRRGKGPTTRYRFRG